MKEARLSLEEERNNLIEYYAGLVGSPLFDTFVTHCLRFAIFLLINY
jgi:hypothetical protein